MTRTTAPSLALYREELEGLMDSGESLAGVADAIEQTPLVEEEQAALWLAAWSLTNGRPRLSSVALARPDGG